MKPAASIVVSGFGVRQASWDRLRSCLEAIALQEVPVEVVLVGSAGLHGEVSEDIRDTLPSLRLVPCDRADPWVRKTVGVQHATAPIVVFVDADCMPQSGWLQAALDTFQYYPEVAAVRGVDEDGWLGWLLPKRGSAGPVGTTSASNSAFRREAYLDCPFPENCGNQAVALQSAAMRRAHYVLWAEPAMQVIRDRRGLKQAMGVQVGYSTATR